MIEFKPGLDKNDPEVEAKLEEIADFIRTWINSNASVTMGDVRDISLSIRFEKTSFNDLGGNLTLSHTIKTPREEMEEDIAFEIREAEEELDEEAHRNIDYSGNPLG